MLQIRLIVVLLALSPHLILHAQSENGETAPTTLPVVVELTEPPCLLDENGKPPEGWDATRLARADGLYFSDQRFSVRGLIEKLRETKTKGVAINILVSPFVHFKRVIQVAHALRGAALNLKPITWATTRKPAKKFPLIFAAPLTNMSFRVVDGKLVLDSGIDLKLGKDITATLKKLAEERDEKQKFRVSLSWSSSEDGTFEELVWQLEDADLKGISSKKKYVLLEEALTTKLDKIGGATLAFAPDHRTLCGHVMKAYEVAQKTGAEPTVITNAMTSGNPFFSRRSSNPRWVPQSIERSLSALAALQGDHGGWVTRLDGDISNLGATSLALLSFLGEFHTPEEGKYKETMVSGVRYLLSKQQPNGSMIHEVSGFSLDHVLATLALIELWGQTDDDEHSEAALKALKFLLRCRNKQGAWGKSGAQEKSDLVVTAWVCLVLQSADDCGLDLPEDTKTRVNAWLDSIMNSKTGHVPLGSGASRVTTVKGAADEFIGRHGSSLTSLGLVVKSFCDKNAADDPRVAAGMIKVASAFPGMDPALGLPDLDYLHFGARVINQFDAPYWQGWQVSLNRAVGAYFNRPINGGGKSRNVLEQIDPVELSILSLCLELSYRYALSHKDD